MIPTELLPMKALLDKYVKQWSSSIYTDCVGCLERSPDEGTLDTLMGLINAAATEQMRPNVRRFLSECAVKDATSAVLKRELYRAYLSWCAAEQLRSVSVYSLSVEVKLWLGEDFRYSNRHYRGIRLLKK